MLVVSKVTSALAPRSTYRLAGTSPLRMSAKNPHNGSDPGRAHPAQISLAGRAVKSTLSIAPLPTSSPSSLSESGHT